MTLIFHGTNVLRGTECANVRYFSLARYALLEALQLLHVGAGKTVLLPEFICRDLLAPVSVSGASVCWYAVDTGLSPTDAPDDWPDADVVLAVNYFGFPQNLAPFEAYALRTGAIVIEDNAHGYLSCDANGAQLGTRTSLGLFSLRKTLRIPDGAALLVNDSLLAQSLSPQLPYDGKGFHPAQVLKTRIRNIPILGTSLLGAATIITRTIRKWRSGNAIPKSDPYAETELLGSPNPWNRLSASLAQFDENLEVARRRNAYQQCAVVGASIGVYPVFSTLPNHCVPYGYPFRCNASQYLTMQHLADKMGFDLVTWPDLPESIVSKASTHYQDIFLINFLW